MVNHRNFLCNTRDEFDWHYRSSVLSPLSRAVSKSLKHPTFFSKRIFIRILFSGMWRIKPGAVGWEARTLLLCYAAPLSLKSLNELIYLTQPIMSSTVWRFFVFKYQILRHANKEQLWRSNCFLIFSFLGPPINYFVAVAWKSIDPSSTECSKI